MTAARPARWATGLGVIALVTVLAATAAALRPGVDPSPPADRVVPMAAVPDDTAARSADRAPSRSAERAPLVPSVAWLAVTATRTGIPARALTSYGAATLTLQQERPGCGLAWNTLAALGQVESGHGGSAGLDADGRPVVPVLGPALNGVHYTAIPATEDSVRWHGDMRWDHAVGPLQFIPSTWRRWRADGDADGLRDPHDLDDAALAAGRYLCQAGGDLATAEGWTRAVFAYNHSDAYVALVATIATNYAAGS